MTFKFLGKQPPVFSTEYKEYNEVYPREEHFRGALKEAADYLESFNMKVFGKSIPSLKWRTENRIEIIRMLRVSAGEE